MTRKALRLFPASLTATLCLSAALHGQITVEGVADENVYVDQVAVRVPAAAGYDYTVLLNGEPFPTNSQVAVIQPDYYELNVERRNHSSGAVETSLVQFIVRSSERQNSEWGLPPWVPYPNTPSAAAEFAGATIKIITPQGYPQGLEIPVVAWVADAQGKRVGVNGFITAPQHPGHSLQLLRGVGSAFLPAASSAGVVSYTAGIHTIEVPKQIQIDASTTWTNASGNIAASTDWGEDARISVSSDLTVAAGATLTVGAGSVIRVAAGAEIAVNGTIRVNGTLARPVVFTPANRSSPWGGFLFRAATSLAEMQGAILTGSGADPDWFDNNPGDGSSHRDEQCCLLLSNGARANLTDCYIVDNKGQAGHGEGSFLTLTRCLVQKAITTGQYNGGSFTANGSALVEFPLYGAPFADTDNDALYMTGGSHSLTDTLVGWAGDDGTDAGSGSAGPVSVTRCWIESCYHEGMAWSETRFPTVKDTVTTNNGQGIECGFGEPMVMADHILSTGNLSGARFGDNYDWDYNGSLNVTNSLLLFNRRDIWGRAWDNWDEHLAQMDLHDNHITAADANHPDNAGWQPAADAALLVPFLPTPATVVGAAIATWKDRYDASEAVKGVPVRLSTFTTHVVSVSYAVDSEDGPVASGTLQFLQGETLKRIDLAQIPDLASHDLLDVTLLDSTGAELSGLGRVTFIRTTPVTLIAAGSLWKYRDTGTNLFTAWREPGFDDGGWAAGPAVLGFGDGQLTQINGGPANARFPTTYFRRHFDAGDPTIFDSLTINLRRDDGAVVYLNGAEVFRSNMEEDITIEYATLAESTDTSETAFFTREVGPEALVPEDNVIAVEVHQGSATSGDLTLDLELIGNSRPSTQAGFVRADANGDRSVDISDAVTILFVLFAGRLTHCEDALDADDLGNLNLTDAIYLLAYLFQGGPGIPAPFPQPGADPTADGLGCGRS